jgi:RNA polymerase sigma factor (sigma-70 family)
MDGTAPLELSRLLQASDAPTRTAAWEELVARHSRLLLYVARSFGGGHDAAMERYTYILEKLYEGNCHRLRGFQSDGRARFSTWLTVAARRLCLDYHRSRYGRERSSAGSPAATNRVVRRNLLDCLDLGLDTAQVVDPAESSAEADSIRAERDSRLRAELEALPASDRLLLALRFEDDLSAARIADLVGLPTPFHVYRRLNAVLARLRAALQAHGIEGVEG